MAGPYDYRKILQFFTGSSAGTVPSTQPAYAPTTLDDAIFSTNDWIRLTVDWGARGITIFERDRGSYVWTIHGRDGNYRMVDPIFSYDGGAFTIGFPTTPHIYHFYSNGTGFYNTESFTWEYETDPTTTRYSESGTYESYGLDTALSRYLLVTIYIDWLNGDETIFYRQSDGRWEMKSRSGSAWEVFPSFSGSSSQVIISFTTTSNRYVLNAGGSGVCGSDNIYWHYSYSSN